VSLLPPVADDAEPGPDQQKQAEEVEDDFEIIVHPNSIVPRSSEEAFHKPLEIFPWRIHLCILIPEQLEHP
jgi:hypothetical protein